MKSHPGIIHDILIRKRYFALPRICPTCGADLTLRGAFLLREYSGRSRQGHLGPTLLVLDAGVAELSVPPIRSGYNCGRCGAHFAQGKVRHLNAAEPSEQSLGIEGRPGDGWAFGDSAGTCRRFDLDQTPAFPLTGMDLEDPWFGELLADDGWPDEPGPAQAPKAAASSAKGAWLSWWHWLLGWGLDP